VLWSLDARSGNMVGDRVAVDGRGCAVRQFTWLAFGDDLETVYCATTSGDLTLVNVRKKCTVGGAAVFAAKSGVQALLCSRAGVFAGGGDGTVTSFDERLHDSAQAQLDGAVVALSFSPDRTELVAGTATGSIYRLRADLSAALLVCENHAKAVSCVAYAEGESSERFATASLDRTVRVWDANDYKCAASVSVRDAGDPQCVVYSLDFLISGWTDGRIRAHDAESARPLWTIDHAHRGGVTALALSHNARFVMTGGGEGDVRVWELRSRELVSHLKEHRAAVTGLALYGDDVHALSCSRDRSFLCWDLRREKRMTSHTQRMGGINAIALGADETTVFTVGQEKRLTSWDLREPNATNAVDLSRDNDDEATSVAVSHDGRVVATAGSTMELKLWAASDNLSPIAVVRGHSGAINDIKFSPDDKQLVSVGDDGVIFVWNLFL
jgi:WD40 repeat protein